MDQGNDRAALLGRAETALNAGRFEEARALCDRVFAEDPGNLAALWTYAHATRFRVDDPVLARIERFADQPALPDPLKAQLQFILAKAYDDLGRVYDSFRAVVQANALKGVGVDDRGLERLTRALLRAIREAPRIALPARAPRLVFILGMPRSGTSLAAQMLGAHPQVVNLGERTALGPALELPGASGNPQLAFLDGVDLARLEAARAAYLEGIPAQGVFIDKMPENYWFAWAIGMLFPDAQVLHMRRDRRATCWSCFRNDFRNGHGYSYDWSTLTRQYDRHLAVCAAARARAGANWHEVWLDDLTRDPRATLTPVLGALGLDWDGAIARPETVGGSMATLSKWQVRQGIDARISGGWRAYAPLIEATFGEA